LSHRLWIIYKTGAGITRSCPQIVAFLLLAFFLLRLIGVSDEIIRGNLIEFAQGDQIFDLQFGSAVFDVAVPLLAFVEHFSDLCLG